MARHNSVRGMRFGASNALVTVVADVYCFGLCCGALLRRPADHAADVVALHALQPLLRLGWQLDLLRHVVNKT